MLRRQIARVISWQVAHHMLAEEDRAIYEYGYLLMVEVLINVVIAIVLGIVKVVNDMVGKLLNGRLQSTKHDGGAHGIGIRSIEKTVEKYGGLYQYFLLSRCF